MLSKAVVIMRILSIAFLVCITSSNSYTDATRLLTDSELGTETNTTTPDEGKNLQQIVVCLYIYTIIHRATCPVIDLYVRKILTLVKKMNPNPK